MSDNSARLSSHLIVSDHAHVEQISQSRPDSGFGSSHFQCGRLETHVSCSLPSRQLAARLSGEEPRKGERERERARASVSVCVREAADA